MNPHIRFCYRWLEIENGGILKRLQGTVYSTRTKVSSEPFSLEANIYLIAISNIRDT